MRPDVCMTKHGYNPKEPDDYDPELDSHQELPVRPKVTAFAILVVVFFMLALLKQADILDLSWWWISLPLWIVHAGVFLLAFGTLLVNEFKRFLRRF